MITSLGDRVEVKRGHFTGKHGTVRYISDSGHRWVVFEAHQCAGWIFDRDLGVPDVIDALTKLNGGASWR